jgi:hypothetical protein
MSRFLSGCRNLITQGSLLRRALLSLLLSVVGAGLAYSAWLALFLSVYDRSASFVRATLWLLTPVVTAVGYGAGMAVADRLARRRPLRFLSIVVWPLIGCVIGAGVVFPFGPMLIVFGMFGTGTAAVAAREIAIAGKAGDPG